MKIIIGLLILIGTINAEIGQYGVEVDESVHILTTDNFDDVINKNEFVFVEFYAPWCGHCKKMAPEYSALSQKFTTEGKKIVISKVDTTVESVLGTRYEIKGFPTLKLFINGKPIDYSGARETAAMYAWLQKKMSTTLTKITSKEDLDKELKKDLFLAFFVEKSNEESLLDDFFALCTAFEELACAHVDSSLSVHVDFKHPNGLLVYKSFDDGSKILTEALDFKSMKEFVEMHRFANVREFDQKAAEDIFGNEKSAIFIFNDSKDSDAIKLFREVAVEHRGEIIFSHSEISKNLGQRLSEFLGVAVSEVDCVRGIKFDGGNLQKFKLEKVTKESIKQFISDINNDKLTPYFKSEEIPASNNEPVKVIVGKNFEEMIINNDNYIFLEAYAPWCGHCKQLEPIFKELAQKLSKATDLVIAKIDATANEHTLLQVKGFPTIKLYKKGAKSNPIDYSGERTLEAMVAFLEENLGRTFDDEISTDL